MINVAINILIPFQQQTVKTQISIKKETDRKKKDSMMCRGPTIRLSYLKV